jgi:hypothetical protein
MLDLSRIDRRTFLAATAASALPLSACEQKPDGSYTATQEATAVIAGLGLLASGATLAGTLLGMTSLLRVGSILGPIAGFASSLEAALPKLSAVIAPPADAATLPTDVKPPVAPQASGSASVNDLTRIAFFAGQADFIIEANNRTNQPFLHHNVFSVVRSVDAPPPSTAAELLDAGALPSFVMSAPAGQTIQHSVPVILPPGQGYVLYSWCIPGTVELTDAIVAGTTMVGPIVYSFPPDDIYFRDTVHQMADWSDTAPVFEYNLAFS